MIEKISTEKYNFSRKGIWDRTYAHTTERRLYSDPATGKFAAGFLNHETIEKVEDWGCGYGGFSNFLSPHQEYIGVDGSQSSAASVVHDLCEYKSDIDGLHLRHVLEHNVEWRKILDNALGSFRKRMVLTLFTPFQDETKVINEVPNFNHTGKCMVDIGFNKDELISCFGGINYILIENIPTDSDYSQEHIFFLEKP